MPLKRCDGKIMSEKTATSFLAGATMKDARRNPSSSIRRAASLLRHAQ